MRDPSDRTDEEAKVSPNRFWAGLVVTDCTNYNRIVRFLSEVPQFLPGDRSNQTMRNSRSIQPAV